MKFRSLDGDAPVLGITECGSSMSLTVAFVGSVEYDRSDSEALADLLDRAAEMVRRHASVGKLP